MDRTEAEEVCMSQPIVVLLGLAKPLTEVKHRVPEPKPIPRSKCRGGICCDLGLCRRDHVR